jgi:hypothetical protein
MQGACQREMHRIGCKRRSRMSRSYHGSFLGGGADADHPLHDGAAHGRRIPARPDSVMSAPPTVSLKQRFRTQPSVAVNLTEELYMLCLLVHPHDDPISTSICAQGRLRRDFAWGRLEVFCSGFARQPLHDGRAAFHARACCSTRSPQSLGSSGMDGCLRCMAVPRPACLRLPPRSHAACGDRMAHNHEDI